MELRKDPITQSWVILGQKEVRGDAPQECPLEPAKLEKLRSIMTWPAEGAWQVRVLPHPEPLYHIEGEPGRVAEGMYDKMVALGAHEIVVETPQHDRRMAQFNDDCGQGLWTWLPLTSALAAKTVAAFARLPRRVFLRSADAVHLICAQEHGLPEIYTNDRHMSAAARQFRLKPLTVASR